MEESDWDVAIGEDWENTSEEDQENENKRNGDGIREPKRREQEGEKEETKAEMTADVKTAMEDIDRTMA